MMKIVQRLNGHYPDFTPGAHSNHGNANAPRNLKLTRRYPKSHPEEDREYLESVHLLIPDEPLYQE